jgi:hypothetical protein
MKIDEMFPFIKHIVYSMGVLKNMLEVPNIKDVIPRDFCVKSLQYI